MSCDNIESEATMECTYSYTTGTTFTDQIQNEFKIDYTVKTEASAQVEGIMKATTSAQYHTGYDWKKVHTVMHSETEVFTVKATAPSGTYNQT